MKSEREKEREKSEITLMKITIYLRTRIIISLKAIKKISDYDIFEI